MLISKRGTQARGCETCKSEGADCSSGADRREAEPRSAHRKKRRTITLPPPISSGIGKIGPQGFRMAEGYVHRPDGACIRFKDWGAEDAQPLFLHHGWPLCSDDWDALGQIFVKEGFRIIAHDRRGHGKSSQLCAGHDLDVYADDVAEIVDVLDLTNTVHIGHSVGASEALAYVARRGAETAAGLVLISSMPYSSVSICKQGGVERGPFPDFDCLENCMIQLAKNGARFYLDLPYGPFYGFNHSKKNTHIGLVLNFWRQSMAGDSLSHFQSVQAVLEADQSQDLEAVAVPTLLLHGGGDQLMPASETAALTACRIKHARLRIYPKSPHGILATDADVLGRDILTFVKARCRPAAPSTA